MKNSILAVVLGTIILFAWGFVSWTLLPWHNAVIGEFNNESIVAETLAAQTPQNGIYLLPYNQENFTEGKAVAFANVLPQGFKMSMAEMMVLAIIGQLIAAALAVWLLSMTQGLSYAQRVTFLAVLGLTIGLVSHFPYWVWFSFSTSYVFVTVLDTLIAWTLAGLAMAKFAVDKPADS